MEPYAILGGLMLFASPPMLSSDVEVKAPPGVVCHARRAGVDNPLPQDRQANYVGVDCEGPGGLRWEAEVRAGKAGTHLVADVSTLGFVKVSVTTDEGPETDSGGDLRLKDADGHHTGNRPTILENTARKRVRNSPHTYLVRAGSYAAQWTASPRNDVAMKPYCTQNLTVKPGRVATFACDTAPGALRVDVTDSRGGAVDAYVTVALSSVAATQVEPWPPSILPSTLPVGMLRPVYPGRYDLLVQRRGVAGQVRIPGVRIEPRKGVRFARTLDVAGLLVSTEGLLGDDDIAVGPAEPMASIQKGVASGVTSPVLAGRHQVVWRRDLDDGCTTTSWLWVNLRPGEVEAISLRPPPTARLQLRCDGEPCADVAVHGAQMTVQWIDDEAEESFPVVWGYLPTEGVELSISPGVHRLVVGVGELWSTPVEVRTDAGRCSALNMTGAGDSMELVPIPSECKDLGSGPRGEYFGRRRCYSSEHGRGRSE
jgi:hypothetical protein